MIYDKYVVAALSDGPSELVAALDQVKILSEGLTHENIREAMPEDWAAKFYEKEPNFAGIFADMADKKLPLPVNKIEEWGAENIVSLIPLTHIMGDYLQELGKSWGRIPPTVLAKLYAMTVEWGVIEQDNQLRFYGTRILTNPPAITVILEHYVIEPLTKDLAVTITPQGPTRLFYIKNFDHPCEILKTLVNESPSTTGFSILN